MKLQLPDRALGQHGLNTYYKEFTVKISDTDLKTYQLGQFCSVRKSQSHAVVIAEFQLIWHSSKDDKSYASAKIYFNPRKEEDAPDDYDNGKDEVIAADRQIVIECCKVPEWECSMEHWFKDVGHLVYENTPEWLHNLYKKDRSSVTEICDAKIMILSFPQYCRYMTCMKMIKMGVVMTFKNLLARGGLILTSLNTIILFQRTTFKKYDLEELSPTEGIRVPAFSGRPRKRKKGKSNFSFAKKSKPMLSDKDIVNTNKSTPPKRNAALMATCALADAAEIMRSKNQEYIYNVPVTRASGSDVATTIHMKLKNASDKKEIHYKSNRNDHEIKQDEFQEDISGEESDFNNRLNQFMSDRGSPILKIPTVGYSKLILHQLFNVVASYGGYGQVTLKKQWKSVYEGLGGGHYAGITNAATCTRKAYEKLLLPYEKHLRTNSLSKKEKADLIEIASVEPNNNISTTVKHGPSFTVEDSNGCKLMIQKRRGRPSKEFRQQIEQLKISNQKVQVEIYPPLSKTSKVPAWMNELNADIVNPNKRKKSSTESANNKKKQVFCVTSKPCELSPVNSITTSSDGVVASYKTADITPDVSICKPIDVIISQSKTSPSKQFSTERKRNLNSFSTKSAFATSTISSKAELQKHTKCPRLISAHELNFKKEVPRLMHVKESEKPVYSAKPQHYIYYPFGNSSESTEGVINSPPTQNILSYNDIMPKPVYVKSVKGPKIKNTPVVSSHYPSMYNDRSDYITSEKVKTHQVVTKQMMSDNSQHREQHSSSNRHFLPSKYNEQPKAPELIPADLIPMDRVRIERSPTNERTMSPNKRKAINSIHNLSPERYRMLEESKDRVDSYKHRPVNIRSRDYSNIGNNPRLPTSPSYERRFSVYEDSNDHVISYISNRDLPEKYIIHRPRVLERDEEHLYPIVYTHVPHQYVNNLKYDHLNNEQQRHTRLVYPNTLVSIEPEQQHRNRHVDMRTSRDRYDRLQPNQKIEDQEIIVVPRNWR